MELHKPPGYHHITVVESGRLAFLAGQCPIDASGALVAGGNIDWQIDQVAANAATALAAVGAKADHVVRSVIYVVSDDSAVLAAAWQRLTLSVVGSAFTTASTLFGGQPARIRGPTRRSGPHRGTLKGMSEATMSRMTCGSVPIWSASVRSWHDLDSRHDIAGH